MGNTYAYISSENDNERTQCNVFQLIPEYLIAFILSYFSHRKQALTSHICKDFHKAYKLNTLHQHSITIQWSPNAPVFTTNPNDFISHISSLNFNDIITPSQSHSLNQMIRIVQDNDNNKDCAARIINGLLYFGSIHSSVARIYIDDRIYIKHSLITKYHNSNDKEIGIFIQTSIGHNNTSPGHWNVGFGIGENAFAFHPGYGNGGAARLEGKNGWHNESMGFEPKVNKLYRFEIFINTESMVYLKVIDIDNDENKYIKQWQHAKCLFVDKDKSIFERETFSLRTHCGFANKKRVAIFGDVDINVAERSVSNGDINIIECDRMISKHVAMKMKAFTAKFEMIDKAIVGLSDELICLNEISESIISRDNGIHDEFVQSEMRKLQQKLKQLLVLK